MGAFDDLIPATKTGGAFDDLIPAAVDYTSGIPSGAELTQIGRENTPAWTEAPAQAVSELIKGMIPHDVESYAAGVFPPLAAFRQGQQLAQGDVSSIPFVGRVPEIMQAEETPGFSKERYLTAMKTLMDVGMLAGAGGERAPSPLRTEPTLAERITQPRVEPAPEEPIAPVTPETPPAPDVAAYTVENQVKSPRDNRMRSGITVFDGSVDNPSGIIEAEHLRTGELQVFNVAVDPALRGTGRGIGLYEKLIEEAKGTPILSDTSVSEAAANAIEGLSRRGHTVEKNPNAVLTEGQWKTPDETPVFKITGKPPEAPEAAPPPVTPAQSPEAAVLERRQGILDRKKELEARAANGEQVDAQLAAVQADLLDPSNPVVHPPPVEVPVQQGEFAKPGYTALPTEPVAAPEPYTPEAAAARAAQPQPATEPVGGNVAGFEKVYGPGEIPAGETISPEDAWDAAHSRATTGKAKPYGFVDRARTGAITPEEMGDLIYEHHRLVERAAGLEETPEYAEASQAAKDFASNVLKPAETAWHQKGMVMQIERPVNLNTFTGMDQLMQTELGRGIKPSEAPKFTRMAEDVKNGESEVAKAVERSDARVRTKYAKVRDIPIEEAVARVKEMLKDCM